MWCLHYVYVPILNKHLDAWKNAWIHHPLRTEGNKSPIQLWIRGLGHVMHMTSPDDAQVMGFHQICTFLLQYGGLKDRRKLTDYFICKSFQDEKMQIEISPFVFGQKKIQLYLQRLQGLFYTCISIGLFEVEHGQG